MIPSNNSQGVTKGIRVPHRLRFERNGRWASQQGVALFVALIILVIISILGISALRISVSNARISTGIQVGTMSFQAAQTAISSDVNEVGGSLKSPQEDLAIALKHDWQTRVVKVHKRCVDQGVAKNNSCSSSQFLGMRKLAQANSKALVTSDFSDTGFQVPAIGGGGFSLILVAGNGDVPSMGVTSVNVQGLAVKTLESITNTGNVVTSN